MYGGRQSPGKAVGRAVETSIEKGASSDQGDLLAKPLGSKQAVDLTEHAARRDGSCQVLRP